MAAHTDTQVDNAARHILSHLPASAHGLVLAELWQRNKRPILHIAVNDKAMDQLADELTFYAPDALVMTFPAWDVMPYDRASPKTALMAERMRVLSALTQGNQPDILIATIASATQKLPPTGIINTLNIHVKSGQTISPKTLIDSLIHQGYGRVGKAMEPGEFAVRGSIIDIIPAGNDKGIRLDWFGDQIESIKSFEPLQQTSIDTLSSFSLTPTSEIILNDETISHFRSRYRELFGAATKEDSLYEAVSKGMHHSGVEHFLPLFYKETTTLFAYLPNAAITIDDEAKKAASERFETIQDYYEARIETDEHHKKTSFSQPDKYHPLPPDELYLTASRWEQLLEQPSTTHFSTFATDAAATDMGIRPLFAFVQSKADYTPYDQLKEQQQRAAEQKKKAAIACMSQGSCERLSNLLMERGFHPVRAENYAALQQAKGKSIALCVLPIERGFETPSLLLFSEADILGERISRKAKKKKSSEAFFAEAASFNENELVVHKEHGIARFEGLVTVEVQGAKHDCLKLIYDGDDKLFLPVENIELVTRYGEEEDSVKLDKLGGASWQSRKAKLKKRIGIAAEALLKIAAERHIKKAPVFEVHPGSYDEFVARFGYPETEDQISAIEDVMRDLTEGKPMDRLICGDVGFGKTEVALRAAFIAATAPSPLEGEGWGEGHLVASEGKTFTNDTPHLPPPPQGGRKYQVALICPTTLLARQHYKNFKERFAGFPFEIRQLSRMVPVKQQKETLEDLKSGEVDIVIGTHALLAKNVEFKNLGLLIVDEEQHFGVAQKEKLKGFKSNVHVLTLSATPIPRTLQMSLTGVRDLSLITTPPVDRLAIRSFVMPFDPVTIRESVMRELHRGGRCFVVTPRIKYIAELKAKLTEILPEAKICIAHGGMPASELDQTMNAFYDGKYNLLLSTAIIESGLDIPSANTMIIHNAHLFGLSQLYQMRGRVGRGKVRAYAYFMLPHRRELTRNAERRLEIMQTLDTLGAGFTLANHDMDIRGFGNLVGEEQSGHIREVGIELYQQMLEEAVATLKHSSPLEGEDIGGGASPRTHGLLSNTTTPHPTPLPQGEREFTPQINLGLSVLIPEFYIEDLPLRMGLYKRAANLQTDEEIEAFAAELIDRFGSMPEETRHLIDTIALKLRCKQAGIERIDVGPKGAVISLHNNQFAKPDALIEFIERRVSTLKIRPDQKLFFKCEWEKDTGKITTLKRLIQDIQSLLA